MKFAWHFFALLMLATIPAPALAAEPSPYEACIEASGGVTLEMLNCNAAEMERLDGELNRLYREAMRLLPPAIGQELREVQRAWLTWRDRHCGFYAGLPLGTSASINGTGCFVEQTGIRVKELADLVELAPALGDH